MSFDSGRAFYDAYIERRQSALSLDRVRQLLRLYDGGARDVLDVGCGNGELLGLFRDKSQKGQRFVGLDLGRSVAEKLSALGFEGVVADAQVELPFADQSFDCVVAAEVIEHMFNTDRFIQEVHRVLRPGGMLLLSTPNLAYFPNRVLLMFGVQPIFTETSTVTQLGRWLPVLGQGRPTEGHTKIFTQGALRELLVMHGFTDLAIRPYAFFPSGIMKKLDSMLKIRASLAAGFAVRAYRR